MKGARRCAGYMSVLQLHCGQNGLSGEVKMFAEPRLTDQAVDVR